MKKQVKNWGALLLVGMLFLSVVGCGNKTTATYTMDMQGFGQAAISGGGFPAMQEFQEKQLVNKYPSMDMDQVEEFIYYMEESGGSADELLVVKVKDTADGTMVDSAIAEHSENMITYVKSYNEPEVTRIENALKVNKGKYYLYAISNDQDAVSKLFDEYCVAE